MQAHVPAPVTGAVLKDGQVAARLREGQRGEREEHARRDFCQRGAFIGGADDGDLGVRGVEERGGQPQPAEAARGGEHVAPEGVHGAARHALRFVVREVTVHPQGQQRACRVLGQDGAVETRRLPRQQGLGAASGGHEHARLLVPEVAAHDLPQLARAVQVRQVAARLEQRHEAQGVQRVILHQALHARLPAAPGVPQRAVREAQVLLDERRVPARDLQVLGLAQDAGRVREGRQGQPVPRGQHLVVRARLRPLRAGREEAGLQGVQVRRDLAFRLPEVQRQVRDGQRHERHAAAAHLGPVRIQEVPGIADAQVTAQQLAVRVAQHVPDLGGRPRERQALHAPRVRVLRGIEAAVRGEHLAPQVLQRPARRPRERRIPAELVGAQQRAGQLGVVVQHLLEVRHPPRLVHAVAVEAAAQLIVQAARQHAPQRVQRHQPPRGLRQQEIQRRRGRELWRAAKAAQRLVEHPPQVLQRALQQPGVHLTLRHARTAGLTDMLGQRLGVPQQLGPLLTPRPLHARHHPHEARQPVPVTRREVRPGVERRAVRRQEHRHRPAALPGQGLRGRHVHRVHVRAFLAVHLHVHEVRVHVRGGRLVLETLVRHHVTPVARRVPHRQQHRHVPLARLSERLLAPRPPCHRVVRVLTEVRAALLTQTIDAQTVHGAQRTARLHAPGGT